jgi:RNA polymerase sigma factor (TIGR02999 family)
MSPEQAAGELHRLGPRADVYSLGARLYGVLTEPCWLWNPRRRFIAAASALLSVAVARYIGCEACPFEVDIRPGLEARELDFRPGPKASGRRNVMPMNDVTHILSAIEQGDPLAAEQLLPLVYDELRKLAAQRLSQEKPGQTLQATALVHDAYLRLVDADSAPCWNSRGHFFAAAAEAMRRILVETARNKKRLKRGGDRKRIELDDPCLNYTEPIDELIEVDEALEKLAREDPQAAQLVKLRYFAGLSIADAVSRARPHTSTGPMPGPGFIAGCAVPTRARAKAKNFRPRRTNRASMAH